MSHYIANISPNSAATRLRSCGDNETLCVGFVSNLLNSERSLKIGQHLSKLLMMEFLTGICSFRLTVYTKLQMSVKTEIFVELRFASSRRRGRYGRIISDQRFIVT